MQRNPADYAADVTPSGADVDVDPPSRLLIVGGAGDVKVDMATSGTVTFTCAAGAQLPIKVNKVYNSGTTATNIISVW